MSQCLEMALPPGLPRGAAAEQAGVSLSQWLLPVQWDLYVKGIFAVHKTTILGWGASQLFGLNLEASIF